LNGVELVSERLVLRPSSGSDLDFYFEMRNSPEILAPADHEPKPRSLVEHQLKGWVDRWHQHGFGTWTVFDRDSDERLGRVELDPMGAGWEDIAPGEIEVGLIVHPTRWSQGIATEAAGLVAADCFNRARLNRLVALTTPDNTASLRTLEKLGFRHRGQTQHHSDPTTYEVYELARPAPRP
jgi:ribosomal-protein-alanine N-acetyltransferase